MKDQIVSAAINGAIAIFAIGGIYVAARSEQGGLEFWAGLGFSLLCVVLLFRQIASVDFSRRRASH